MSDRMKKLSAADRSTLDHLEKISKNGKVSFVEAMELLEIPTDKRTVFLEALEQPSKAKVKDKTINVRVNSEDWELFKKHAESKGLSASGYLNMVIVLSVAGKVVFKD